MSGEADAAALIALVAGRELGESWIELRYQPPHERSHGWPSRWFRTSEVDQAAPAAVELGQVVNVYVGTAPRVRKRGTAANVAHGWIISVDADTDDALGQLAKFPLAPTMIIASGGRTPSGRFKQHAHWQLAEPLARDSLARLKSALASALGSDPAVASAAGILRVPGTHNHKPGGGPVRILQFDPTTSYAAAAISAAFERMSVIASRSPGSSRRINGPAWLDAQDDPVMRLPPPVYFRRLTGLQISRRGDKVACCLPGHIDETPSLHVYGEPWLGWYCYGCRRGGSAYDLAGHLHGVTMPLRADRFIAVHSYLRRLLVDDLAPPHIEPVDWART